MDKLGPYELGRVHCADCIEAMKLLPDRSVDAVVTDPPYCSGGRQQAGARGTLAKSGRDDWFLGDNMGTDTYLWFMRQVAIGAFRVASPGAPAYVFTDWRQYGTVVAAWESARWTLKTLIVWDKARGGAMGSWWRNNHEFVCGFVKGKARPLSGCGFFNTWTGTKPQGGKHPTEKPIAFLRYIISSITPPKAIILDPFAGSGTTGVAASVEGHSFLGFDNEMQFVKIANSRLRCDRTGSPDTGQGSLFSEGAA